MQLLTTAEVAELLGISPRTVQRKVASGEIPAERKMAVAAHGAYLFDRAAIEALASEQAEAAS